jgi:hypothetical protein
MNNSYQQSFPIYPPEGIYNKETQRFGISLSFFGNTTLFIASLRKSLPWPTADPSGVFIYSHTASNWTLQGNVSVADSGYFEEFGQNTAVLGNSLVAVYGSNANSDHHEVFILKAADAGTWNFQVQQIIDLVDENLSETGMFFCSQAREFLALVVDDSVLVYEKNNGTGLYEFFQAVSDPKISGPNANVPYADQFVVFGSGFAWNSDCESFVIGAMSKEPGPEGLPLPYGRSYIFSLQADSPDLPTSDRQIIIVVAISAIILIGVLTVVGLVVYRRRVFRYQKLPEAAFLIP